MPLRSSLSLSLKHFPASVIRSVQLSFLLLFSSSLSRSPCQASTNIQLTLCFPHPPPLPPSPSPISVPLQHGTRHGVGEDQRRSDHRFNDLLRQPLAATPGPPQQRRQCLDTLGGQQQGVHTGQIFLYHTVTKCIFVPRFPPGFGISLTSAC